MLGENKGAPPKTQTLFTKLSFGGHRTENKHKTENLSSPKNVYVRWIWGTLSTLCRKPLQHLDSSNSTCSHLDSGGAGSGLELAS